MLTIIIRTIIIYFALIISVRIMGKRQIGELQVSEFIITVILSEIAAAPISDPSIPIYHAIVPMLLLLSIELFMSYALMKSSFLRKLFCGSPTLLIHRGKLIQPALRKNRIELDELLSELRQKGYPSLDEVYYAILEENGKLSVIPRADQRPLTPNDMQAKVSESGIAHPLIIDGDVKKENFPLTSWSEQQLECYLRKKKISTEDVFLLTVDDCDKICLIKREDM